MAIERAGGSVVAGNPVLVGTRSGADDDGIVPVDAVRGAVHRDLVHVRDGQRRNDPHAVSSVEGYDRIAGRAECALLIDGDAGQGTMRPGRASVGGSGKTDVGCATAENAAHLEGAHNRGTRGKGADLHLSRVLAAWVGESVGAELGQRDVGRRGHVLLIWRMGS